MDGTGTAAQHFGNVSGHFHPGHVFAGIHFLRRRCKQYVCAHGFCQLAVVIQRTGIGIQVFRGAELRGIYKVTDDGKIIFSMGRPNQRSVAFMQRTHGGNQADGPAALFYFFHNCLQFCNSFY